MGTGCSQDEAPQVREEAPPQIGEEHTPRKTIIPQNSEKDSKATEAIATEVKLPHNYEAILRDADSPVDNSSTEKLYNQLQAGVFLNQKRKKYWVDGKSNRNCFVLFARDLSITWAEDNRYWHWPYLKETRHKVDLPGTWQETYGTLRDFYIANCGDVSVDIAELLKVCWLEIHGNFGTVNLSQGTIYEVVFLIMLKDPAFGWEVPVNIRLILPDGTTQHHEENLMGKSRGQWIEIPAGEFRTSFEKIGNIQFSLYEYKGGNWKTGLLIKGVVVRPKA